MTPNHYGIKVGTMNTKRIENVIIYRAERTRNSVNGNPGYKLHTSDGVYPMQTDAALGYAIDNYVWSEHRATRMDDLVIGNPAEPRVTLLATPAGRVWGIEYNGEVLR